MRFLLARSGGWLVLLEKQESDPKAGFLHLHVCLLPVTVFTEKKTLPLYRQGKCGEFSCITAPVSGCHYILHYLLCRGGSFFNLVRVSKQVWVSMGV